MKLKKFGYFLLFILLLTLSVKQVFGCTDPDANFTVDNTTPVIGQTVTFTNTTVNNDGNVNSWVWNFGSGASPTNANGIGPHNVLYTSTGYKTVSLTVSWPDGGFLGIRAGSNTETKTNYINVSPTPVPTAGNNGPVCEGSTLSLTASTISGATYSWTGPNSFSSNQQNPTVSTSATTAMAGTYSVTATLYGYTGTAGTTTVTVNPKPVFTYAKTDITCFNAGDGTITINASGGTPPYTYSLDGGSTFPYSASPITGLGPGNYIIAVKDAIGCIQTVCN